MWKTYGISHFVLNQFPHKVTNVCIEEHMEPGVRFLWTRVSDWWDKSAQTYVNPKDPKDIQQHLRPDQMRDDMGEPIREDANIR